MAQELEFTLKRNNGTDVDILYPATTWAQVKDKPSTYTPTAHTHSVANITGLDATHRWLTDAYITTWNNKSDAHTHPYLADTHPANGVTAGLITNWTSAYNHISNTSNPHGVTKAQVGLTNVTDHAQVKKIGSSTIGNIPTWSVNTGDSLGSGYAVETTLTNNTGAIPLSNAVKSYVDNLFSTNDAMVFKGTVGSGGTYTVAAFNTLALYNAGDTFKVITAGTIRGKVCEVGDLLIATVDRASGALDADWVVIQTNIDGAVTGPASAAHNSVALFNGTTGKIIKDSAISFETTLSTGSDSNVPTSKAIATYVTSRGYVTSSGVTSVTGTSPIASSGGATPVISVATGYTIPTTTEKGNYDTAYNHSQVAHAPSSAQKNSDITKAEIEAKLTGVITTHSHADNNTTYTFATGTTNGTFKVTPSGGSSTSVSIYGLGSAAYTSTSNYEPAIGTKGTAFNKSFGSAAGTVTEGNDTRLSDARTPTSHNHSWVQITSKPEWIGADKPEYSWNEITNRPTFIIEGDIRLTNARTPTSHSHSEYVPTTRKIAGKQLSGDILLSTANIGDDDRQQNLDQTLTDLETNKVSTSDIVRSKNNLTGTTTGTGYANTGLSLNLLANSTYKISMTGHWERQSPGSTAWAYRQSITSSASGVYMRGMWTYYQTDAYAGASMTIAYSDNMSTTSGATGQTVTTPSATTAVSRAPMCFEGYIVTGPLSTTITFTHGVSVFVSPPTMSAFRGVLTATKM